VRSLSDPIVANLYRRTSDGRTLFCPWGNFGRAYIVPPDREAELSSFVRRLYLVMLGTIPVAAMLLHWWAITLAPVFTSIWFYRYWSFSRTLDVDPSGPPPFDRRQAFMNAARASGAARLWFFLCISLVFAAGGVWVLTLGDREGIVLVALFGLGVVVFGVQLIMLGRKR
jgi:hypothetical protein